MTEPLKHLSAIGALVDAAQRHGSKLAAAFHPDSLAAAAAVALQHALECAQVQALRLRRALPAAPKAHGQEGNKQGAMPCLPEPAAPA
jgi:hypothetical protein